MNGSSRHRLRIGLALGGGAARGWAHVGVIRGLEEAGLVPDVVAGTSVGAIVGAMYCSGHLGGFERWVRRLTRREMLSYLDLAVASGGFFEGRRLAERFRSALGELDFDSLHIPLGIVATELYSGHERWLRSGDVGAAIRASISLPGLFTPVRHDGEWLVDGGLVNPVPVSLCHAMGADVVIAVNLNGGLVGRHLRRGEAEPPPPEAQPGAGDDEGWLERLSSGLRDPAALLPAQFRRGSADAPPGLFDVIATAINVMQDRITRSRMAGDPPELLITPRLAHIALLEFYRAAEVIDEGQRAVTRMQPAVLELAERVGVGRDKGDGCGRAP